MYTKPATFLPPLSNLPIQPLIISYDNPTVLSACLNSLANISYPFKPPVILDNCSSVQVRDGIYALAHEHNCKLIKLSANLGWGASINYFLDYCWDDFKLDHCILLVMAHDCLFLQFDADEVMRYFSDPNTIFVCPNYPVPTISRYNILKSYYSKPGKSSGRITIGHQTAFFASPYHLRQVRYDEQFWLYGGEYEIFSRANRSGLRSYQAEKNIVVNPSSDSASESCYLAYKLNSLYCAYKRHWWLGFWLRALVIIHNIIFLWIAGNRPLARQLANCLLFTFANPGCGLHAYRSSPALMKKYNIYSLIPK